MNPRIKELAEQAEGTKKHVPAVWQFYDHELEKFAELIVQECANLADTLDEAYQLPSTVGTMLRQYFKVKP